MLDDFEADDAVEETGWPGGIARDKRVVGVHVRKPAGRSRSAMTPLPPP